MRIRPWTEKEIKKLEIIYTSGKTFEEIVDALPNRSPNAIRQKASRMGIRRPTLSAPHLNSNNVLQFSDNIGGSNFIIKCSECGNWMVANLDGIEEGKTIVCKKCSSICRYVS
jgi:hypothetical protein